MERKNSFRTARPETRFPRSAEVAIKVGALAITAYELLCPEGETISEGTDRYIEKHPVLTRAIIGYTALHLMNLLPEKLDLFHRATKIKSLWRNND